MSDVGSTSGSMVFWTRLCELLNLDSLDKQNYILVAERTKLPLTTVLGWQRGARPKKIDHWRVLKHTYKFGPREMEYLHIGPESDLHAESVVEDLAEDDKPRIPESPGPAENGFMKYFHDINKKKSVLIMAGGIGYT